MGRNACAKQTGKGRKKGKKKRRFAKKLAPEQKVEDGTPGARLL